MEHIILSHVSKHLASNRILTDAQHGFRQGLSTTTQLSLAVDDWSSALQHRSQVDAIFLDFQKAFDRVPHQRLQIKLQFYGISGDTLNWIMSFLTDRQQAVVIDGTQSSWRNVSSGVPQCSVLGPTLFLIFINDITDQVQSKIRLFADDCVVYRDIASEVDHQILQHDLAQLSTWSSVWQMSFNVKKCGVLSITRKRSPSIFDYKLHNDVIPRPTEYKYLGVTVTPDLRWNTHCQKIRHKASRTLGLIRRTLSPCSMEVKTRAYAALVRPQLEYAAEAWNPHTVTTINALEQVQKAAARFVHGDYRRTTSSSALVSALGWHTLHNRRLLAQCVLFHKVHHQLVCIPYPQIISPATYIGRHDHQLKYTVPKATMDSYKFSVFPRATRLWNNLPGTVVQLTNPTEFREAALQHITTMQPSTGSTVL